MWVHSLHRSNLPSNNESQKRSGLVSLGQTCRAWHTICAPDIYRKIFVRSRSVNELISELSIPGSCIVSHAQILWMCGHIPWLSLPRLLAHLPHVHTLTVRPHKHDKTSAIAYQPAQARLTSSITGSSPLGPSLTSLSLFSQWFASTADILRMLALLPRLSRVTIRGCKVLVSSVILPLVSCIHLRHIFFKPNADGAVLYTLGPALAHWWMLPRAAMDCSPGTRPFPGLRDTDSRCAAAILTPIFVALDKAQPAM